MNRIQEKFPSPKPFSGVCENPENIHEGDFILGEYDETIDNFYNHFYREYNFRLPVYDENSNELSVFKIFDSEMNSSSKIIIDKKVYSVCEKLGMMDGFKKHGVNIDEVFKIVFEKLKKSNSDLIQSYDKAVNDYCEIYQWEKEIHKFGYDFKQDLSVLDRKIHNFKISITRAATENIQKDYFNYKNSRVKDLSVKNGKFAFCWFSQTPGSIMDFYNWISDDQLRKMSKDL